MNNLKVGIIMGSDSDLQVMSKAAEVLDALKIGYELKIISAHRTPDIMYDYAKTARDRGLKIIIAGAGGAAHLPGMVAALTTLPVIGVPVMTKTLNGVDSLYSIVQMPNGIPVATVAINGALNAGLLAAQILGAFDESLLLNIIEYKKITTDLVIAKAEKIEEIGYEEYLKENN